MGNLWITSDIFNLNLLLIKKFKFISVNKLIGPLLQHKLIWITLCNAEYTLCLPEIPIPLLSRMLFAVIYDEAEWSIHGNCATSEIIKACVPNKTLTGKKTVWGITEKVTHLYWERQVCRSEGVQRCDFLSLSLCKQWEHNH